MQAAKLEHSDLIKHQVGIVQQFREFWLENHLCDVVLKSNDGSEHRAHAALLSAASMPFKNMLSGSFLEADRVQRGQPVEIAASKAAVSALVDFIYGGQPEVNLEVGLELLRLAEAYDFPKLAGAIEAGFGASLDSSGALRVLQEAHGLNDLKAACEEMVAKDFETCIQQPLFGKLSLTQLARILKRSDLCLSREESVLKGIFNWLSVSMDRNSSLGMLLQHVDFQSISVDNLLRLGHVTLSGPDAGDLQREVHEALRVRQRKRPQISDDFLPKRRCLQHWSPDLGASSDALGREVLSVPCSPLCWHEGAIYASDYSGNILCWKPGDAAANARRVVGQGVAVTGINDLGQDCELAISPTGEIFVADDGDRLVSFENGSGRLVLDDFCCVNLFCSPAGVLYVLRSGGRVVQKLVGSTLQTVIDAETLPADLQFEGYAIAVTKEEVIYLLDNQNSRILRIDPAEPLKPSVVGEVPSEQDPHLYSLFVTEAGTVYVTNHGQRNVLAFRPGNTCPTEVLQCPDGLLPMAVLVHGRSMYVGMVDDLEGPSTGGIYECALPPELQLKWKKQELKLLVASQVVGIFMHFQRFTIYKVVVFPALLGFPIWLMFYDRFGWVAIANQKQSRNNACSCFQSLPSEDCDGSNPRKDRNVKHLAEIVATWCKRLS